MKSNRMSGILLHPSSLPGPDGIGDIGPEAYEWVNFLVQSGCNLWQLLPLGPTGYGDSPYQCFSAFAGNPYLISSTLLIDEGLLLLEDLQNRPDFSAESVDFGPVIQWKLKLLDRAYDNFKQKQTDELTKKFQQFIDQEQEWLLDFALFMAIKEVNGGLSWDHWDDGLRKRDRKALEKFQAQNKTLIESHMFKQFLFFTQWTDLKNYANDQGIKIIGDIPIFISFDSSDAWSNPDLFYFDEDLKPTVVAGVPPDYFSATGQLWGNPLYRWNVHKEDRYKWWLKRIIATLKLFDFIRLDHFRGFVNYWEVPAGNKTAEIGRWLPGPGDDFFEVLQNELGVLPIIAEDLGEISKDVYILRDQFNLPGMKICQFAFSNDPDDPFLPHNYPVNCVAYTGTHDNDTVLGWYHSAPEEEQDFCRRYLARSGENISWDLIRVVWSSVAKITIAPLQDFLGLGTEARMNYPGRASGNWSWRVLPHQINSELALRINEINLLYSRSK
ncbi:MAG: 4-alpha-glucanotransferase [Chloroflexi bacterium HGW-Chloroflexi-3]|nr:MAG: 4-alpha-glucanotransferase [Chloroflexi bacterium HGW-Chloroflexi-3]